MFSAIRSYSRVLFLCAAAVGLSGCIESDAAKPFTKLVSPVKSGYAQYCHSGISADYVCFIAKVTAAPNAPTRVEYKEVHASTSSFLWIQVTTLEGGRFLLQNIGTDRTTPKPRTKERTPTPRSYRTNSTGCFPPAMTGD